MKIAAIVIVLSIVCVVAYAWAQQIDPTTSETGAKGWKMSEVIALRSTVPDRIMGEMLQFSFPNIPYRSDDPRLSEIIGTYGCGVYMGGGFPGAPLSATCKDVKNAAEADAKIKAILPALNRLALKLRWQ